MANTIRCLLQTDFLNLELNIYLKDTKSKVTSDGFRSLFKIFVFQLVVEITNCEQLKSSVELNK